MLYLLDTNIVVFMIRGLKVYANPNERQRDEIRAKFLEKQGIEELRVWNHQWRSNREGVLLEIWRVLHRRTGCIHKSTKRVGKAHLRRGVGVDVEQH